MESRQRATAGTIQMSIVNGAQSTTKERDVRNDPETIPPIPVARSRRLDEPSGNCCFSHHLAAHGIPRGRNGQPHVGGALVK